MRTENVARNSFYGIIKTLIQLFMRFATRTIIINFLSEEYLGVDSLFSSILQVLSLAELGFGSVIIYSMYKPVAENDIEKISSLLAIYKKIYWIVGCSILVIGLCITPFLKHLISGDPPSDINIYVVFIIFLLNTVGGYTFAYKRSLLAAYQRNDIENKIGTYSLLALGVMQIVFLTALKSYYAYVIFMPIFTVLENVIITIVTTRMYPNIKNGKPLSKQEKIQLRNNTFAMMGQQLGNVAVFSTDNIIISAFLGLSLVGLYNNYYLLISAINAFIAVFFTSITSTIGNSVADEKVEKNYLNFRDLSFFNLWITVFCGACFISLFQPFITLWIGEQYLLGMSEVICIIVSFICLCNRRVVNTYRTATGTFYKDRFKPILEAVVNLVLSLIFVRYLGLTGILLGTICSHTLVAIPIEAHTIFKHYFKKPVIPYLLKQLLYFAVIGSISALTWYICSFLPSSGVAYFIAKLGICLVVPNLLMFIMFFWTPEFKYLKNVASSIIGKVLSRFKKSKKDTDSTQEDARKLTDESEKLEFDDNPIDYTNNNIPNAVKVDTENLELDSNSIDDKNNNVYSEDDSDAVNSEPSEKNR